MSGQGSLGSGCLKIILAIFLGFFLLSLIGVCFAVRDSGGSHPKVVRENQVVQNTSGTSMGNSGGQNAGADSGTKKDADDSHEKKDVIQNVAWMYAEEVDDFDGKVVKFCGIESNNYIKSSFSRTKVRIILRQTNKKMDVIVFAENVVIGNLGSSDKVRLKFDDEEPFSVGYNDAANGSADRVFLRSTSKIIDKLKNSKKLVIELPVFMESGQRASFDIAGYNEVCTF